jgi:hypothetical protein
MSAQATLTISGSSSNQIITTNNQPLNTTDTKVSLFCKGMWKGFKEGISAGGLLSPGAGAAGITVTTLLALGIVGTGGWAGVALLALWAAYVIFNTINGGFEAIKAPEKNESPSTSTTPQTAKWVKEFDETERRRARAEAEHSSPEPVATVSHNSKDDNNYGAQITPLSSEQSKAQQQKEEETLYYY